MEIFVAILNEKMYEQLRTKEDLCYKVGCELKKIGGTVGITFYIQSEKYDPIYLQLRILDFIDNFYFHTFDKKLYTDYKKGVVDKKKKRHLSIHQEAATLADQILCWCLENNQQIDWN